MGASPFQTVQYGHKLCSKCDWSKPLVAFAKAPRPSGRAAECLECRLRFPSQSLERRRVVSRSYYKRKGHARLRDKLYGLEAGEYEALLASQDGVCAICKQHETAIRRDGAPYALTVDHDHGTGAIRALLCSGCNKTLSYMNDNPARLRAAADYLEAHRNGV